jgi:hypothetical protein
VENVSRLDHGQITAANPFVHAGHRGVLPAMSQEHWHSGTVSQITIIL